MIDSSICERLKLVLDHFCNSNNSEFAKVIGTSEANIRNWTTSRVPKFDVIETVAQKFELNNEWLLTGNGEMLLQNVKTIKEETEVYKLRTDKLKPTLNQGQPLAINEAVLTNTQLKRVIKIPIHAHAGFLHNYGDVEFLEQLPAEYWEVDQEYKGNYLVFEVKGDSMDNDSHEAIKENDRLLCREVQREFWKYKLHINQWDFVIAHKDQGVLVKRILEHDVENGTITCHSLNSYYENFTINLQDVLMIYNVVDLKRSRRR